MVSSRRLLHENCHTLLKPYHGLSSVTMALNWQPVKMIALKNADLDLWPLMIFDCCLWLATGQWKPGLRYCAFNECPINILEHI